MKRGFEIVSKYIKDDLVLPFRGSKKSAGYDFSLINDIVIEPGEKVKVETGIKAYMLEDEVLEIHIRSSLGIKGINILNTVGIIDSDYFNNETNEGEIIVFLINNSKEKVSLEKGTRFVQGIFKKYLIIDNDEVNSLRKGGFGSTK